MAVWSEIRFSNLNLSDRFDAEYFQPSFLEIATALEDRGTKLRELGDIKCSAFYPAATHLYEFGNIPFIRCVDVINHPVITDKQQFEKIPEDFVREHRSVRTVKTGDIVITKVGSPCFAGIIHESLGFAALSRTVLGITTINQDIIDPYYLTAFLRSRYGFYQLMREREQLIQLQLTLDRVGNINVFLPSRRVQTEIGNLLREYYVLQNRSQELNNEIVMLLLDKLSQGYLDLSHNLTYEASFAEVSEAKRLDAEYFQPKYYRILDRIHRSGYQVQKLGDLIDPIINGYDAREYVESGTPYIRVGDVYSGKIHIEDAEKVAITQEQVGKNIALQTGDILFTRKGSYGNAAVVRPGQENAIISSEIMLLRIKSDLCDKLLPDYLALFLNSELGYQQVERHVHGVAFYSIAQPDLAKIEIVLPPLEIQEMFAAGRDDAIKLEHEADALLKQAIQYVEVVVSRGE